MTNIPNPYHNVNIIHDEITNSYKLFNQNNNVLCYINDTTSFTLPVAKWVIFTFSLPPLTDIGEHLSIKYTK
jgi:hypothetical protein